MANQQSQPLMLGNVTFANFEVPEELPNLFGVQKYAIHDFPSTGQGTRTAQELGAFPFPAIEWHGTFFNNDAAAGMSAISRASQVNTYRTQGQPQMLIWGPFQYQVLVAEFEVMGRMAQQLDYRIKLIPLVDYTTTSNTPPTAANATQQLMTSNAQVLDAATSQLSTNLPAAITTSASTINGSVSNLLQQSGGSVSNITPTQQSVVLGQIAALQLSLAPIIGGTNYAASSAALILSGNLFALSTTLQGQTNVPLATIVVTNPNLPLLASQYYGNDTLWPLIAQANNLQDMFPLGTFTLIIPQPSTQSNLIPAL